MNRIYSIDYMRGLVMVIMALDHVRDLMHVSAITQNPVDLTTTTPGLFFTRWVTHLCPPTFVFLAGTSACLNVKNQDDRPVSRHFLLTRGLWLVLMELTVVNFGIWFDVAFHTIFFQVIAAIGVGFIVLGLMLSFSARTIGLAGLGILFLHNLFPAIPFGDDSTAKAILSPFFTPGLIPLSAGTNFIMGYPPVPWLGIMMAGYGAGPWFEKPLEKRQKLFLGAGIGAILLFILLRTFNIYGEPASWSVQKSTIYSLMSFLNVSKYPPSLLFALITLGIMFLLLARLERPKSQWLRFLSVYGKVPMFYFILHFYLIHTLLLLLLLLQGFSWADMDFASGTFGRPKGVESGVSLGVVYAVWIAVVLALYWPCRWYGAYKHTHKHWWLRYL